MLIISLLASFKLPRRRYICSHINIFFFIIWKMNDGVRHTTVRWHWPQSCSETSYILPLSGLKNTDQCRVPRSDLHPWHFEPKCTRFQPQSIRLGVYLSQLALFWYGGRPLADQVGHWFRVRFSEETKGQRRLNKQASNHLTFIQLWRHPSTDH